MPTRDEARRLFGLDSRRNVVGLVGGSQGAARLNLALLESYGPWRGRDDLAVIQGTGAAHARPVRQGLDAQRSDDDLVRWDVVGFQTDMPAFYAACDVVVARAGANTMAELLATGTPAVMVPGTFAEGHQAHNAAVAGDAGAAVIIPDGDVTGSRLRQEVQALLADPERRARMAAAGRAVAGSANVAADRLAALVLDEPT